MQRKLQRLMNYYPYRHIGLSCIALLLFLIASCSNKLAEPQSLLLIEHSDEGKSRIFTVQTNGLDTELIAEFSRIKWYWPSSTGKYLAFIVWDEQTKSYNLNVLEIDSGKIIANVPQVMQTWSEHIPWEETVSWSSEDNQLAFLRSPNYGIEPDIFVYDLHNETVSKLTNDKAVERAMSWSPNGERLAFVTWDGCEEDNCIPQEFYWNIDIMNADGTERYRITAFQDLKPFTHRFMGILSMSFNLVT